MNLSDVAIIIPAAGRSTRFGEADKLSAPFGVGTLLGSVVACAVAQNPLEVVVVVSAQADTGPVSGDGVQAPDAWAGLATVRTVVNSKPSARMGDSISLGVAMAHPRAEGFLIWPGDMPLVGSETLRALAAGGDTDHIVRPLLDQAAGKPVEGHPVLFGGGFRPELEGLAGQEGARSVIERHRDRLRLVPVSDEGVVLDVDTPADLERLSGMTHA